MNLIHGQHLVDPRDQHLFHWRERRQMMWKITTVHVVCSGQDTYDIKFCLNTRPTAKRCGNSQEPDD